MAITQPKSKKQPLLFLSKHRKGIAFAFFVIVAGVALRHYVLGGGPGGSPGLCAYCPLGAIASLYVFLVHGQFLRHIHPTSVVVLAAVILVTLFSRRAFCGWICPFGTLQEWLASLGRKIFRRSVKLPAWLDGWLRYAKYGVLLIVIGASWYLGTLVFRKYDPYLAAFDFGASLDELWPGYITLALVVLGALFIERFWCRYACPLGALLGLLSKVGMMKIIHQEGTCTNCKAGIHRCPMGINPTQASDLCSAECIQCMECVAVCPIHNAVHVEAFGKRMQPALVGVSIVGTFLLVIAAAQYLGAWQTLRGGLRSKPIGSTLDVEERMVTGVMTLNDVRKMYEMEGSVLRRELGIEAEIPMDTPIRELKQAYGYKMPSPNEMQHILTRGETSAPSAEGSGELPDREARQSERATAPSDRRKDALPHADLVRGWMTLEQICSMYGMQQTEFRELIGIPESLPMSTVARDLELMGDGTLPTTGDIRRILAPYRPIVTPEGQPAGSRRSLTPGAGRFFPRTTRPRRRGGMGRTTSGSLQTLCGATTLQEALAYSGKTLEQVKKDWNLSFVDPQINLGALARMIGIPMWELRDYFQKSRRPQ